MSPNVLQDTLASRKGESHMLTKLFSTTEDYALTVLRITLGVVFFAHGAQKVFGWFGGYGFDATMGAFTQTGIPIVLAFLAIAAEFLGGLGLLVGLFSRIAAFGVACVMAVAITKHTPNGFFMNWASNQKGEGYEFHLLALAITVALMLRGAGALSLDWFLYRRDFASSRPLSASGRL